MKLSTDSQIFALPKSRIALLALLSFTHSIYWLTAWWSPWPFLILTCVGLWISKGVFRPWNVIISHSLQTDWDATILQIIVPFIVVNYIAIFSCLYMFGSVVDIVGNEISGTWKHFHFSAATLTTLGYGNFTPRGLWAEAVATVQAIVGFMGFAVLAGIVAAIILKRVEMNQR